MYMSMCHVSIILMALPLVCFLKNGLMITTRSVSKLFGNYVSVIMIFSGTTTLSVFKKKGKT